MCACICVNIKIRSRAAYTQAADNWPTLRMALIHSWAFCLSPSWSGLPRNARPTTLKFLSSRSCLSLQSDIISWKEKPARVLDEHKRFPTVWPIKRPTMPSYRRAQEWKEHKHALSTERFEGGRGATSSLGRQRMSRVTSSPSCNLLAVTSPWAKAIQSIDWPLDADADFCTSADAAQTSSFKHLEWPGPRLHACQLLLSGFPLQGKNELICFFAPLNQKYSKKETPSEILFKCFEKILCFVWKLQKKRRLHPLHSLIGDMLLYC